MLQQYTVTFAALYVLVIGKHKNEFAAVKSTHTHTHVTHIHEQQLAKHIEFTY